MIEMWTRYQALFSTCGIYQVALGYQKLQPHCQDYYSVYLKTIFQG